MQSKTTEAKSLEITNEKGSVPLYIQLKALFSSYISDGTWLPGSIIPSELQLAQEINVSQGTVRKAITELVESNVLIRRQGRGTFVAIHDDARALFHFFHIVNDDGNKALPKCETISCRRIRSTRDIAKKLSLGTGEQVISIERIRKLDDQPAIIESILLPSVLFADLGKSRTEELPNTLYELYETHYGITIHKAEEQIRAIPAGETDAGLLGVDIGSPLLMIERVAYTLDGRPVEIRISRCNTLNYHYQNTVL